MSGTGQQHNREKGRQLNRKFSCCFVFVCLAAAVLLVLWWSLDLKSRQADVRTEWALESGEEQSFTASAAAGTDYIAGIGFTNDDAAKSVFDDYETRIISGTAFIRDADGNTVWSADLQDAVVPTWQTRQMEGLSGLPVRLKDGETYTASIEDESGKAVDGITWTLYGERGSFAPEYAILCVAVLLLLLVLYLQYQGFLKLPFPVLWIGGILAVSLISVLAMSPPCVPDEELHFGSSYAVSTQIMRAVPFLRNRAELVPTGVLRYVGFGPSQYLYHFWTDWQYGNLELVHAGDYYLAGQMPHYSYVVPAIGITLMRILHAPYQLYILAGRFMNVLLYGLVTLLAIRVNPRLKPAVAAVTWIPSSLWIVNSCSYDVWNLAFCILFVCWCDRIGRQEKIRVREFLAALALLVIFVPIKFIYFNFALFILLLRIRNLNVKNPKRVKAVMVLLVAVAVAAVVAARGREAMTFLTAGGFDSRAGMTMESSYSLPWVLHHPAQTVLTYLNSLYSCGPGIVLASLFGDQFAGGIPLLLKVLIMGSFGIILAGIRWESSGKTVVTAAALRREWILSWLVVLSGIFIVMSSFLFVYSSIPSAGIGTIEGMQGRYFIPFLICLPLMLPGGKNAVRDWAAGHTRLMEYLLAGLAVVAVLTRFAGNITSV